MPKKDPRIDAYIAKAPEFARPILKHLRAIVREGCPDVEETMKWSVPHFDYKGPLAGMAAFKAHCAFGFWKGSLVVPGSGEAMGQFGRITKVGDLPKDKVLLGYVKKAVKLNDEGIKVKREPKHPKTGDRDAGGPRGGSEEEREGARDVRGLLAEPQARVPRVDHRREGRRDARAAPGHRDRVHVGGQVAQLEVPALSRGQA